MIRANCFLLFQHKRQLMKTHPIYPWMWISIGGKHLILLHFFIKAYVTTREYIINYKG